MILVRNMIEKHQVVHLLLLNLKYTLGLVIGQAKKRV
jgi:hypothetical protein